MRKYIILGLRGHLNPLVLTSSGQRDGHPRQRGSHNSASEKPLTAAFNQELTASEHRIGSNVVEAGQTPHFIDPHLKSNVIAIQEIETWVEAIGFYDNNDFDSALRTFVNIPDTAKILFNCGVIHATLGEHNKAVGSSKGYGSWDSDLTC